MAKTPEHMFNIKQKNIRDRCNLKDKQIAYFNSVNAAISLLGEKATKEKIIEWRSWFYCQWEIWYEKTNPAPLSFEEEKQGEERVVDIIKEENEKIKPF